MTRPSLGVLLAGGRSTRMGSDKAFVEVGGEPLWRRQARTLADLGCERIVASRQAGQAPFPGLESLPDEAPDLGPMGGLLAGLRLGAGPLLALLAVDVPGADAAWFAPLLARSDPRTGAVYQNGGYLEPLAGLYPAAALDEAVRRVTRHDLSLQGLCRSLEQAELLAVVELPGSLRGAAANLNEAGDLASWRPPIPPVQ